MLRSPSVRIHILRGIIGAGLLAVVLICGPVLGWWTLFPAAVALLSFGGCPMCWIVGLAGTILDGQLTSLRLDGTCPNARGDRSVGVNHDR